MAEFNAALRKYLGASKGAYSQVTNREGTGDKSVTVDKDEKSVLFTKYDKQRFERGGGDVPNAHRHFNVWDPDSRKYELEELSIKYPKRQGTELRLYFNRDSGFYPEPQDIWFIFTQDGVDTPFIGFMDQSRWEDLASGDLRRQAYVAACDLDDEDEEYQRVIQSPSVQIAGQNDAPKDKELQAQYKVTRHKRSAALAAREIKRAGRACQFDPSHKTFTAGSTGAAYVEVHHLIPMAASAKFEHSLDVSANLIVLCPLCHRAIHYGDTATKRAYLDKLFAERKKRLAESGVEITLGQLYRLYGVADDEQSAS
jgi:5-methylcytosine-specific restriction protein A